MIHDLQPCSTGNTLALPGMLTLPMTQPVADVATYLRERKPAPNWDAPAEHSLFIALPATEREEVTELLAACERVLDRTRNLSVSQACAEVLSQNRFYRRHWKAKTFRTLFDKWRAKRDWLCLVNRSKCPASWRQTNAGLPRAFLEYVASVFGQFKRDDGKRQALLNIKRIWRTGRTDEAKEFVIPGYEAAWKKRQREIFPPGWDYSNILRQIKKAGLFTAPVKAWLHEGEAAARELLPQVLGTRRGLRFLEKITFDDVRTDWMIRNDRTGKAEELWLLIARDEATAMVLGFVMHPASERLDGKAAHLGLAQMKQLAGWLLERYALPPYVVTWKIERGTATLNEAMKRALGELLGGRIVISYTSMIGDSAKGSPLNAARPHGYKEKAKGNSRGKASHESHNRLFHTQGSNLPGQIGAHYEIRPADINARIGESEEIFATAQQLPVHLRGAMQYPLLDLKQAREQLFRLCRDQNEREDHKLEDFEQVVEWFDGQHWQPAATFNFALTPDAPTRKRMEKPIERAARLAAPYAGQWKQVSPHVVAVFYEHLQKIVHVEANGEIKFDFEKRLLRFVHGGVPLVPGTEALAYYHPDDPKFLHLTDGKGAVLGTWICRDRVGHREQDALAEAMRYTHTAREAARLAASTLAAPERAKLEAMRAHNAQLIQTQDFTDVTEAPEAAPGIVGSPVGAALTAVSEAVKTDSAAAKAQRTREANAAAAAILTPTQAAEQEACADDFLAALSGKNPET